MGRLGRRRPLGVVAAAAAGLLTLAGCGQGVVAGSGGDARTLLGEVTWQLVDGVVDGEPLVVPDGSRVTLTLDGTDQVGGTSACNGYGGTVRVRGSEVSVGELGGTDMGCEPDVMAAESTYLDGLARVTAGERTDDGLVLSGDDVAFTYEAQAPVPTAELVGTTWRLGTLVDGDVASSVGGEPALLRLDEDGRLTGSTGCRDLSGEFVVTGDEVLLTSFSAGDRECPPDLVDQDSLVVEVLGDGFRAEVDGAVLTLSSDGGLGLVYGRE